MSNCPSCGNKLHLWNLKAECPHCGANIPNHAWEERLEEDAVAREAAFYKMHSNLAKLKFTVVGNLLRILRFAFAFLPIIGYVLPLCDYKLTDYGEVIIDEKGISVISLFTEDALKIGNLFKDGIDFNRHLPLLILAASLFFGVIAFFLIPILFKKPKQPVTLIAHVLSLCLYVSNLVLFPRILGDGGSLVRTGEVRFGVYIGIALFTIALILDIIVLAKPLNENDGKYIPDKEKDELQYEYALSIGAIGNNSEC